MIDRRGKSDLIRLHKQMLSMFGAEITSEIKGDFLEETYKMPSGRVVLFVTLAENEDVDKLLLA